MVLVRSDPHDVARVVALSRASYRKMVQESVVGRGGQHRGDPVGGGVLAGRGIVLSPAVGAVLDVAEHGDRGGERITSAPGASVERPTSSRSAVRQITE